MKSTTCWVTRSQASWKSGGSWGSFVSRCSAGTLGGLVQRAVSARPAWPPTLDWLPLPLPAAGSPAGPVPGKACRPEPGPGVKRG